MRKHLVILLALMAGVLASCVKNEFTVEFAFQKEVWGNYYVYYYASDKRTGMWLETTAPLHDGKYTLKGVTRMPTLVYVCRRQGGLPDAVFYAERGDRFVVSGKSADPADWKLDKGNKISEQLMEWHAENGKTLSAENPDSINAAVKRLVLADPESKVATIALMTYYDRRLDPRGFSYLWNALAPDARPDELTDLVGATDLAGTAVYRADASGRLHMDAARELKSIAFPVPGGIRRNFRTTDKDASIFFFGRNGLQERSISVDTLRRLSKAFPDSASRLIAYISLEGDSLSWIYPMQSDSLRNVANGWMPLAETDPRVRALGIVRIPWWIVTDSKGRITYSGDRPDKAAAGFRKLMSAKKKSPGKTAGTK